MKFGLGAVDAGLEISCSLVDEGLESDVRVVDGGFRGRSSFGDGDVERRIGCVGGEVESCNETFDVLGALNLGNYIPNYAGPRRFEATTR